MKFNKRNFESNSLIKQASFFAVFGFLCFFMAPNAAMSYCTPSTFGCDPDWNIVHVELGSINHNTAGCASTSPDSYTDYSDSVGPSIHSPGGSLNYEIQWTSTAWDPMYYGIWVDWTNDGGFDDFYQSTTTSSMTHTGNINIPSYAETDTALRVRIVAWESIDPAPVAADSCNVGSLGEYLDYSIEVEGIDGNDAGITEIFSPESPNEVGTCQLTNNEAIEVEVSNFGDELDTFPVAYQVNNGSVTHDTLFSTIEESGSENFTFSQEADLSYLDSAYTIKVWTEVPNDVDNSNDTSEITINSLSQVANTWFEDFEDEESCSFGGSFSDCNLDGHWINNDLNDDMNWSIKQGPTPTQATGPFVDHSIGVDYFPDEMPFIDNFGGKYLYIDADGHNNSTAHLMSPCIDPAEFDSVYLTFRYFMYGNDLGDLEVQVDTGGNWNTIWSESGEQQNLATDSWLKGEVSLPQNEIYSIRFAATTGGGDLSDIALDDIRVDDFTPCSEPTNIQVNNYYADSVNVNWTPGDNANADSWTVEYGTPGFSPGNGDTTFNVNDTFTTVQDLTPGTEYDLYISENCNGNESSYPSRRLNFTTDCSSVADTLEENDWPVQTQDPLTIMPDCWSPIIDLEFQQSLSMVFENDDHLLTALYINDQFSLGNGGLNNPGNFIGVASRPLDDLTSNERRVSFEARYETWGDGPDDLIVGTMSNRADPSDFEAADTINASQLTNSFQSFTVPLTDVSPDHRYLVFRHADGTSDIAYITIDEILYEPLASCDPPSNFAVDSVSSDSAWVSWTGATDTSTFHLEYGSEGFEPGEGDTTITGIEDTSFVIGGLDEAHEYEVLLREKCSEQGLSDWVGPEQIATPCGIRSGNFVQNFAEGSGAFSAYPCWNFLEDNDISISLTETGPNGAPPYPVAGTHELDIWRPSTASTSETAMIVSPQISDLGERNKQVRFHAYANTSSLTKDSTTAVVGTLSDPEDINSFNTIDSFVVTDDGNWSEKTAWFNKDAGSDEHFAIRLGGRGGDRLYIDSIVYEPIPACPQLYAGPDNGFEHPEEYGLIPGDKFLDGSESGTLASPDTICVGDSAAYDLTAPYGFDNDDFNQHWTVTDFSVENENSGTVANQLIDEDPANGDNAMKGFVADNDVMDSIMRVDVTVEYSNIGCDTTLTRYVYVGTTPDAEFSLADTLNCSGQPTTFNNESTVPGGNMDYNWSFSPGHGGGETDENPSYTYQAAGAFEVSLVTTASNSGCVDSTSQHVQIDQSPEADFDAEDGCEGDSLTFDNQSGIPGGASLDYSWDFGDGETSTDENPAHLYDNPGEYDVTLVATAPEGCTDTVVHTIEIHEAPTPEFTADNACAGSEVTFSNESSIGTGTIPMHEWKFGDGESAEAVEEPVHTYDSAGEYEVSLISHSDQGCIDSVTKNIEIYDAPQASFDYEGNCLGQSVFFDNTSLIANGDLDYHWEFGNGDTSSVENPQYVYNSAGEYEVSLIAFSDEGCIDSTSQTIEIYDVPEADFTADNVCDGNAVSFNNDSEIASGNLDFEWDFGDGETSTEENPQHHYDEPGTYEVTLIAVSDNSCNDTISQNVEIYPVPEADIADIENVCYGATVAFEHTSTLPGDTHELHWNFGDGNTSSEKAPEHQYSETGEYEVSLIVETGEGCADTATSAVEVLELPDSEFDLEYLSDIAGVEVTAAVDTHASYEWNFGDGTVVADEVSYQHSYDENGEYHISLTVEGENGCTDSTEQTENIINVGGIEADPASVLETAEAYPNPFSAYTTIEFSIDKVSDVGIDVYDLNGRKVAELKDGEKMNAGTHNHEFNANEHNLTPGTYIVLLQINDEEYELKLQHIE